jgi:tetratricopeptide (TPR) repeat protein
MTGEAIAAFNKAIELNPEDQKSLAERASAYKDNDQFQEALADFNLLIDMDKKNPYYFFERANVHSLNNHPAKALADVTKSIRLHEKSKNPGLQSLAFCYAIRTKIYLDLKIFGEAAINYEKANSLIPVKPPKELKNYLFILKKKLDKVKNYQ